MSLEINQAINELQELQEDSSVPKNVRNKINSIITSLQQQAETTTKISRALQDLEEISEDNNMQSYTRMQLFNVVSLLEQVQ
jgi:uncharacterized protein